MPACQTSVSYTIYLYISHYYDHIINTCLYVTLCTSTSIFWIWKMEWWLQFVGWTISGCVLCYTVLSVSLSISLSYQLEHIRLTLSPLILLFYYNTINICSCLMPFFFSVSGKYCVINFSHFVLCEHMLRFAYASVICSVDHVFFSFYQFYTAWMLYEQ